MVRNDTALVAYNTEMKHRYLASLSPALTSVTKHVSPSSVNSLPKICDACRILKNEQGVGVKWE